MAIDQKDEKNDDHLHFTTKTAIKTTPCLHNTPQWVLSKVVFKKKRMELKENDHDNRRHKMIIHGRWWPTFHKH
jgi:hypothetical protein